jgi:hypothetical protein
VSSCGGRKPIGEEKKEDSFLTRLDRSKGFQGVSLGRNILDLASRVIEDTKLNEFESVYTFVPTQKLTEECKNDIDISANTNRDRIVKIEVHIYCPSYEGVLDIFKREYGDPESFNNSKAIWESSNTYLALTKIGDSTTTAVYVDKVLDGVADSTAVPAR